MKRNSSECDKRLNFGNEAMLGTRALQYFMPISDPTGWVLEGQPVVTACVPLKVKFDKNSCPWKTKVKSFPAC